MKRPVDWSELRGLDPSLVSAIRDIYTCPAHFDGAFDDEEGASLTTAELLGDKKPAGEIEQAAAALWKWKQRRLSRGQSSTHQLAAAKGREGQQGQREPRRCGASYARAMGPAVGVLHKGI